MYSLLSLSNFPLPLWLEMLFQVCEPLCSCLVGHDMLFVACSTILVEPNCEANITETGSVLIKVLLLLSQNETRYTVG